PGFTRPNLVHRQGLLVSVWLQVEQVDQAIRAGRLVASACKGGRTLQPGFRSVAGRPAAGSRLALFGANVFLIIGLQNNRRGMLAPNSNRTTAETADFPRQIAIEPNRGDVKLTLAA